MSRIELYPTRDISPDMFPNFTVKMADKLNHDSFCKKRKGQIEAANFFTADGMYNRYAQFTDINHDDTGYVIMGKQGRVGISPKGIASVIARRVFEKKSVTSRTKTEVGRLTIINAFALGGIQPTAEAYGLLKGITAKNPDVAIIEPVSSPDEFIDELVRVTGAEPTQKSLVVGNQIKPTQSFVFRLDNVT